MQVWEAQDAVATAQSLLAQQQQGEAAGASAAAAPAAPAERAAAGEPTAAAAVGANGRPLKDVTNRLLNMAVRERRCKDNCSIMLVRFVRAGPGGG